MSAALITDAPLAHLRWNPVEPIVRPPVLLLHGVGGGRQAWDDASSGTGAALAAAGFRALAVDFPGYGLSATISPYDLAGLADAVERLIDWLDCGPAVVVGHSMGGMVAQELLARAPQAVAMAVLASTSPAFGKPGGDWQRDFLQSRFAPLDAGLGMAGLAGPLVSAMVAPEMSAARRAVAALVSFDRRAALPAIQVPTLVVTGELDRTAAPEVARRMAGFIPGAQFSVVPGAGHLLNIEQPEVFNRVLLDFVQQS